MSLFLDRTGEPATQQQVSSRLKNKDTSFLQPTTHPDLTKPDDPQNLHITFPNNFVNKQTQKILRLLVSNLDKV